MMRTSAAGRAAIAGREGCRLKAYRDSVGVFTIGVGHTGRASPPDVTEGMAITTAQADTILSNDLLQFEKAVNAKITHPISQNAFDALVSLVFNIGASNFQHSSVARYLAEGDMAGAADAFLMWNKAGGKVLPGLETRRAAEREQFLKPDQQITRVPPIAPKPSTVPKAAAGAVVITAGAGAIAASQSGHAGLMLGLVAATGVAIAVFLVLHFRKKA